MRALALCGPTSSGKSELASLLAAHAGGEIVNADSRQIYAGMRIGTGWPSDEQFARAPHHLYGIVAPDERYSAGRFVEDAGAVIREIAGRGRLPIVVGGTGLYIEALAGSMPLDRLVAGDELRARVRREAQVHPHEALREWLLALDPGDAARLKPGDRYRTLRGLEAALAAREATDATLGRPRQQAGPRHDLDLSIVVLTADPAALRARIAQRVHSMFAAGLVAEALEVRRHYGDAPALSGIGYAEALAYAAGEAGLDEAHARAVARTRAYAKRQQTWFRRIAGAMRLDAFDPTTPASLREFAREFAMSK